MSQFCIGGGEFPDFGSIWPTFRSLFVKSPGVFPEPPYDLKVLHTQVTLPSFGLPELPNLLTWIQDNSFSMPQYDLLTWLNELISNFLINLIGLVLDPIEALLGALILPEMPCPSGYSIADVVSGSFPQIASEAAAQNCLPGLAFISAIMQSIKNGLAAAQALIVDLISKTVNFIPALLQQLLDYFDSLEIPGLPSLPSFPEIPSLGEILNSLPELTLESLRGYLSTFTFSVPGLPEYSFSELLPDPLIESPIGPLAVLEGIKAFICKMSNLVMEAIIKFWNDLSEVVGGLIPAIPIPEICFPIPFGTPGPPF